MMFQKKVDRAFEKLHEESDHPETEEFGGTEMDQEMPELEKNDFLAMVIAALITIVPIGMIALLGIIFIGYFIFLR